MAIKVGITGGIGSGKSVVARVFSLMGIPVLHADTVAKQLMDTDEQLKSAIIDLLGEMAYKHGRLDRAFVAAQVFNQPNLLEALNKIVHPATIQYSEQWAQQQAAPYVLKEAAILFESGSYRDLDKIIGVYASPSLRLKRAMSRDGATEADIRRRMDKQMDDDEKMKRCDYVIINDETQSIIHQVLQVHEQILLWIENQSLLKK
jgi:dephospho-CoA kinase